MSEQRLIDANAVEIGFDELCQSPYFKNDVSAKHGAETLMDLCVRSDSHKPNTIDPETLPVVRELREKLEQERKICDDLQRELVQVAKERDRAERAVARLIKKDANPCVFCAKNGVKCSGMNPDFCDNFVWRSLDGDHP